MTQDPPPYADHTLPAATGGFRWTVVTPAGTILRLVRDRDLLLYWRLTGMTRTPLYLAVFALLLGGCIVVDETEHLRPDPRQHAPEREACHHWPWSRSSSEGSVRGHPQNRNAFQRLPGKIPRFTASSGDRCEHRESAEGLHACFVVSF
jgi:hypothetical protein